MTVVEVGQGYAYQWETAAYLVLRTLRGTPVGDELDWEYQWIGSVAEVTLEGSGALGEGDGAHAESFEDITLHGEGKRRLSVQVKKRTTGQWKLGDPALAKFLARAERESSDTHHFAFLTNAALARKLRTPADATAAQQRRFVRISELTTRTGDVPTGGAGQCVWMTLATMGVSDVPGAYAR